MKKKKHPKATWRGESRGYSKSRNLANWWVIITTAMFSAAVVTSRGALVIKPESMARVTLPVLLSAVVLAVIAVLFRVSVTRR